MLCVPSWTIRDWGKPNFVVKILSVDDSSKVVGCAQRIETLDSYVFPLSIESGLAYMHSIKVPTDDDLQHYPHVLFSSPDIWDVSVLDHSITPALLEEIHQEADDSLLQDSMFDEFGDLDQQVVQHLDVFWDSHHTETGEHTFCANLHHSNLAEEDWKSHSPFWRAI